MKILRLQEFLNEAKSFKYEFGCVMLRFKIDNWKKDVLSIIDEEDVYDEPSFGLEEECHVTVFFGILPDETKPSEIKEKLQPGECNIRLDRDNEDEDIIKEYNLSKISIFENEDYDVVKFEVEDCQELKDMNKFIKKEFPNEQTFPDYKPHVTVGYVKKGKGKKYVQELDEPIVAVPDKLVYSYPIDDGKGKRTINIIEY
jgi:2'-5' RNA ligase